jgi:hypothetical protein
MPASANVEVGKRIGIKQADASNLSPINLRLTMAKGPRSHKRRSEGTISIRSKERVSGTDFPDRILIFKIVKREPATEMC